MVALIHGKKKSQGGVASIGLIVRSMSPWFVEFSGEAGVTPRFDKPKKINDYEYNRLILLNVVFSGGCFLEFAPNVGIYGLAKGGFSYFDSENSDSKNNSEKSNNKLKITGYSPIIVGAGAGIRLKNIMFEYSADYFGSYGWGQRLSVGLCIGNLNL